jgi:hypothetical protein
MSESDGRWEVQLLGDSSDLEHLERCFGAGTRIVRADQQDAGHLYWSSAFEGCSQSEQVLKIASDDLVVLSGILKLVRHSHQNLRTGAVYKYRPDGNRDTYVHLSDSIHVNARAGDISVSITDVDGNLVQQQNPTPPTVAISALAAQDVSVKKAMRLFASVDAKTWVSLYRIYEVIEADVGGEHAMRKLGWRSESDLKRFKHSSNSVSVAGDAARHGKEQSNPPADPMKVDEAFAFVTFALHKWLARKAVSSD